MKNLLLATLLLTTAATSCTECPPSKNLPDGFAIGRATVQGAQLALFGADAVFEFWAAFADTTTVAAARPKYLRIRVSVVSGLQLALDGIAIAESQKSGFDLNKLMAQAEASWKDLRAFLATLQAAAGASQPTSVKAMATISKVPGYKPPVVEDLPLTLLRVR